MILQTVIFSTETSDFLKEIIFLESFNPMLNVHGKSAQAPFRQNRMRVCLLYLISSRALKKVCLVHYEFVLKVNSSPLLQKTRKIIRSEAEYL